MKATYLGCGTGDSGLEFASHRPAAPVNIVVCHPKAFVAKAQVLQKIRGRSMDRLFAHQEEQGRERPPGHAVPGTLQSLVTGRRP